jgi:NTE family protein
VLSSGGPRGFVHVGVVKALQELGLVPDVIVGASVGALVGTLCAAGMPAADIERAALRLQPWELVRWALGSQQRLAATGLASWVQQAVDGRPLQALPTPVLCAVQRLRDGAVLGFNRGHAGLAVQAASRHRRAVHAGHHPRRGVCRCRPAHAAAGAAGARGGRHPGAGDRRIGP